MLSTPQGHSFTLEDIKHMPPVTLIDDMGVDNIGFLIESLGADASELQYLREIVQNAFESIQRAARGREGIVLIDYEVVDGVKKLRITDNGQGVSPDEVRANINMLSASGGEQAFDKNFGIGAKITAGVRNPHGVMYKSWKDGNGTLTVMGRIGGRYGRVGFDIGGDVHYWIPLLDEDKPEIIDDSGVSVVLLGKSHEEETAMAPLGAELPSQWVAAYLERRYFELPVGVSLRVQRPNLIQDSGRKEEREMYDNIKGQRYHLDQHSDSKGKVDLAEVDAKVWWWLLTEEIIKGGKTWNNRGHVASIYQNELYEVRSGFNRLSALKDFGIYAGHGRVVIYVEPTNVLKANTARTSLVLVGNRPVDYPEIGAAFAGNMPDELAAFMAGQVTSEQSDHRKAIRKNIQEVEDALSNVRYRHSDKGEIGNYEPEDGLDKGAVIAGVHEGSRRVQHEDASGRIGSEYLRKAREEQERRTSAERANRDPLPYIKWDETGETVQHGRAATYVSAMHVVTASAKFPFYLDILDWSVSEAESRTAGEIDKDALMKICVEEVRRWFEQAFCEAVVALRPLAHNARWGPKVFDTGLSDEGLTAAVLAQRYHILLAIRRGLAQRLGRERKELVVE